MAVMNTRALEPGLLRIFRIYVLLRSWALLLIAAVFLGAMGVPFEGRFFVIAALYLSEAVFLFGYLFWRWGQEHLGRWYLPIALGVAAVGPILQIRSVLGTADLPSPILSAYGLPDNLDFWLIFPFLTVPLILTAWQYDFREVQFFCLGTTAFEIGVLQFQTWTRRVEAWPDAGTLLARLIFMLAIGYIVSYLMAEQRVRRRELAQANRKLVRYAATREQLAVTRERNRLARELHDTLAHTLSGLAVQLDALASVWQPDAPRARQMLDHALETTRGGLDETRRALQDLRAAPLEDLGLALAIRNLAESAAARGGLHLVADLPHDLGNVPVEIEQAYYRVAQEALENVAKHAGARSVKVVLSQADGELRLTISDDGQGFAPDGGASGDSFGLQGMRERAALIGGRLAVESRPDQGTFVSLATATKDW
jgi:signal transduction histidine kinase